MFAKVLKHGSEWNPQLVRELKGRLNSKTVGSVLFLSGIIQCLIVGIASRKTCLYKSDYSSGYCPDNQVVIEWQFMFNNLSFIIPLILWVGGVYLLSSDLVKEQRRGTLNFLRLSPRTSQNILIGKLLGVPVLLYLGLGLAIPLHLICAIAAGIPLGWVLGFYAVVLALGAFLYLGTLLNALFVAEVQYQSIISSALAGWLGYSLVSFILYYLSWKNSDFNEFAFKWFFSEDFGKNYNLAFAWLCFSFIGGIYWIWQGLNRYFKNPNGTLLSKAQSYGLTASFQIWILGMFYPWISPSAIEEELMPLMSIMSVLTLFMFLLIIPAISTWRPNLLDWARYAHENRRKRVHHRHSKWQDWMWGEKSPSVVAIAINFGIVAVIWIPWILLWHGSFEETLKAGLGLVMTLNLIWIYSAIAQSLSLIKSPKPVLLSMGMVIVALTLPLLVFVLFFKTVSVHTTLWMLFVFGSPWFALPEASTMAILVSLLGQFVAITALMLTLNYQIHQAGVSHSKLLFASHARPRFPKA